MSPDVDFFLKQPLNSQSGGWSVICHNNKLQTVEFVCLLSGCLNKKKVTWMCTSQKHFHTLYDLLLNNNASLLVSGVFIAERCLDLNLRREFGIRWIWMVDGWCHFWLWAAPGWSFDLLRSVFLDNPVSPAEQPAPSGSHPDWLGSDGVGEAVRRWGSEALSSALSLSWQQTALWILQISRSPSTRSGIDCKKEVFRGLQERDLSD